MRIERGNVWVALGEVDAICVTTNGCIKRNGRAVMGRGIARTACDLFPNIDITLAADLRSEGLRVVTLCQPPDNTAIVAFPTKGTDYVLTEEDVTSGAYKQFVMPDFLASQLRRPTPGSVVPGWACRSDLALIRQSCQQLVELTNQTGWTEIHLPMPGCGNGGLQPQHVRPILEEHFDDRFTVYGAAPRGAFLPD